MGYTWIAELNFFCAICLTIIFHSINRSYDHGTRQRFYLKTMRMAMLSFLLDAFWALSEGKLINVPPFVMFISNGLYYIAVILAGYWWLCYVEVALESKFLQSKIINKIAFIPVIFTVIGVIISYRHGFFFYIDSNGIYHRGKYILLHTVCCHLYTILVSGHALVRSLQTKNYIKAKEYRVLSIFLFFPLSMGIIQIIVPQIPTVCVGLTLAYLYVYIDIQDLKISIDPLSGINNRNQLIKYLSTKIRNDASGENLFLLMIDINKFKKINDTFGHVEGDKAIVKIAETLKKTCSSTNNFVGRYGGDEFIIVCSNSTEEKIKELENRIHSNLFEACTAADLEYDLSLSIGYAKYNASMKNIQEFIAAADKMLYERKEELKK